MSAQPPRRRPSQPFATGRSKARHPLRILLLVALLAPSLLAGPARGTLALSDTQQLVVEAWRLVNQSYVNPARFDQVHWKRLRQKALEADSPEADCGGARS